jgi:hypothetical protein
MLSSATSKLQTSYQTRLGAIGQQAKGLEKLGSPELTAAFLESSLTDTVESYSKSPDDVAYTKMLGGVSKALGDFPEIQKSLWQTALQVVSNGVPGAAGVALAKSLETLGNAPAEAKGIAATEGLYAMRVDHGQTFVGDDVHANIGYQAAGNQEFSLEQRDLIAINTISTIAALEDWNIR